MEERTIHEESFIEACRRCIEEQYQGVILSDGHSYGGFGSILCYELHQGYDTQPAGLPFNLLAEKWGISVTALGELIWDHCKRLETAPQVKHN